MPFMTTFYKELLSKLGAKRVTVVGDVMLDEYVWGKVTRISPEAPIPVVEEHQTSISPGGAANAAANIASLGGQVSICSTVGDDEAGSRLREELQRRGIQSYLVIENGRPTTRKTRVMGNNQQLIRIDRETIEYISRESAEELLRLLEARLSQADAVLLSDYGKGVTEPEFTHRLISKAKEKGLPIIVDPKGDDYTKYKGATIITPNEQEATRASKVQIQGEKSLLSAMRILLEMVGSEAVVVTRGENGLSYMQASGEVAHIPTFARQVFDVTGAGDTFAACLTLALASGATLREGVILANHAAGVAVSKVGTAQVTREELARALQAAGKTGLQQHE